MITKNKLILLYNSNFNKLVFRSKNFHINLKNKINDISIDNSKIIEFIFIKNLSQLNYISYLSKWSAR